MSNEDQKRTPDPRDDQRSEGSSEPGEGAPSSPEDPASLRQPGEDAGTIGETEDTPDLVTPAGEEPTEDELASLAEELELTRRERDEYLDALRRLKAEFENSRKRQEKERSRLLEAATERLVLELLPVLDNLERALEAEGDIREGVRATRDQLAIVLGNEGLMPVSSDGQPFDPSVHEAVMTRPAEDQEEGTILQTFERGYLLKGKPIRPAKVVVAQRV